MLNVKDRSVSSQEFSVQLWFFITHRVETKTQSQYTAWAYIVAPPLHFVRDSFSGNIQAESTLCRTYGVRKLTALFHCYTPSWPAVPGAAFHCWSGQAKMSG